MSYMIKYIYRKYKIIYLDNTRAYNNIFISGLGVSNVQRCNIILSPFTISCQI